MGVSAVKESKKERLRRRSPPSKQVAEPIRRAVGWAANTQRGLLLKRQLESIPSQATAGAC